MEKDEVAQGELNLIFRNTNPDLIAKDSKLVSGEIYDSADDRIIVTLSKNVSDEMLALSRSGTDNWKQEWIEDPLQLKYKTMHLSYNESTQVTSLYVENFLTPPHKYEVNVVDGKLQYTLVDKIKERFDTSQLQIDQLWVDRGLDQNGVPTQVPYYIVYDKTKIKLDNNLKPTAALIYAYGGFGVGMDPSYLGKTRGRLWLNNGGVYVLGTSSSLTVGWH